MSSRQLKFWFEIGLKIIYEYKIRFVSFFCADLLSACCYKYFDGFEKRKKKQN